MKEFNHNETLLFSVTVDNYASIQLPNSKYKFIVLTTVSLPLYENTVCQVPRNFKARGLLLARDSHAGHFGYHFRVQFTVRSISAFS